VFSEAHHAGARSHSERGFPFPYWHSSDILHCSERCLSSYDSDVDFIQRFTQCMFLKPRVMRQIYRMTTVYIGNIATVYTFRSGLPTSCRQSYWRGAFAIKGPLDLLCELHSTRPCQRRAHQYAYASLQLDSSKTPQPSLSPHGQGRRTPNCRTEISP